MTATHMQTPRKTAAGLGAAKGGTSHFIQQRVTAIALVALVLWFILALVGALHAGYPGARAFIANPVNAVLLILLVTAAFWHMQIGLQVIIEDYIGKHGTRAALLLLNIFVAASLWVIAAFSILSIAL
jgi:succinate dehydrogenase / fumarate reductase membrane anchor subunit